MNERARDERGSATTVEVADLSRLLQQSSSLVEVLRHRAEHESDRLAYTFLKDGEIEDGSLTYADLDRRAREVGAWLDAQGARGERVLLLYPPGLEFLAGFFGCLYSGAIAVPLYPPRPNRLDERILEVARDAGARFALVTGSVLAMADRALRHSPRLGELKWHATDEPGPAADPAFEPRRTERKDLAYLQYTSGSTREPKGVMVTHGNVLANVEDIHRGFEHDGNSVAVTWLPHFHDMGLVYGLLAPALLGIPCYFMPPAAFLQRPVRWLEAVSRYGATHTGAPNFAYELCARRVTSEQKAHLDLSRLAVAFNGAEPIRVATLEAFARAFGPCGFDEKAVCPAYGLAEATLKVTTGRRGRGAATLTVRSEELERHRAVEVPRGAEGAKTLVGCGRPERGTEIRIVHPDTRRLRPEDEIGEIWVRSPSVAAGYWGREEETTATFQALLVGFEGERGFLRTGDLGFLREGELFITGRIKGLIIVRGRNHYPHDIELTVEASYDGFHPQGAAAFSISVGDEERLVIVQEVERTHRRLDAEAAFERIRRAVAEEHELTPCAIALVRQNGVPRTSSGKVQRSACARAFLDGTLPVLAEWGSEASGELDRAEAAAPASGGAVSRDDIESYLSQRLALHLHLHPDDVDLGKPFSAYGMDSAAAMTFLGDLEAWLGRTLSPTIFYNYPTIQDLTAYLSQSSGDAERC